MERPKKDGVIFVKADRAFTNRVRAAALLTDTTVSQFTRDALRAHLERLSAQYPQLTGAASPQTEFAG